LAATLGLKDHDIVVTVRPPATEAHYHNPASEVLFNSMMDDFVHRDSIRIVLLPRNKHQQMALMQSRPEWFSNGKVVIPSKAVDGLNLIWNSDLVVSGGGTMNREAAALDVPVYSIFRGPIGAIDKYLQANGRLTLIGTKEDIANKIRLVRRQRTVHSTSTSNQTLKSILHHIEEMLGA
jgi:predicted glycosyltransferase